MDRHYYYSLASFDESIPKAIRKAGEALAKARATSIDSRASFAVLEENYYLAIKKHFYEAKSK